MPEGIDEAAGKAAGEAAKEEAASVSWPPTEADAERISGAVGAAAAGAACVAGGAATYGATTALEAAGICSAIGKVIGEFVGEAVYDLVDSWFGTSDATQRHLDSLHRKQVFDAAMLDAGNRLYTLHVDKGPKQPRVSDGVMVTVSSPSAEISAMKRWGLRTDRYFGWDIQSNEQLSESLRLLFIAESARAAEIVASNPNQSSSSKNSVAAVIVLGVVSFIGVGLLQKFITRGKF
jgi:hypothetical protein